LLDGDAALDAQEAAQRKPVWSSNKRSHHHAKTRDKPL